MTAPYQPPPKKKKKPFTETPAPKTPRAPVDTTALKGEIDEDDQQGQALGAAAARLPKSKAEPIETLANQADMDAYLKRGTLDSARAGQIPAVDGRAKIAAAMTKKKKKP